MKKSILMGLVIGAITVTTLMTIAALVLNQHTHN